MSDTTLNDGKLLGGERGRVLLMLIIFYTFNFIDRQIIGILAVPIKADLLLTDTQLGLMGGLAFALFYAIAGFWDAAGLYFTKFGAAP